jgi:ABC-type antimicrobial peptide transport system permease subunit
MLAPDRTTVTISVRTPAGSPALRARSVGATLTAVDPAVAFSVRPLAEYLDASLAQERMVAMVAGFFGALALLLAALGLYGMTSYAVSRRRAEIGIRLVLGAAPAGVIRLVLTRVAVLVGAGVLVGAFASAWLSQFVAALLYGLEPRDPITLVSATMILGAVGTLAGWLPAARAARIDPAEVLRES